MAKLTSLAGKNVLLTGASRGIGLALARALAREGARLALAARNGRELEKLAAELRAAGAEAVAAPLDLCDDASVARGVAAARAALGELDVLVNDAGLAHQAPFLELAPEQIRAEIETNYLGAVRTVRAVLPAHAGARLGHDPERVVGAGQRGRAVVRDLLGVEGRARRVHVRAARRGRGARRARDPVRRAAHGDRGRAGGCASTACRSPTRSSVAQHAAARAAARRAPLVLGRREPGARRAAAGCRRGSADRLMHGTTRALLAGR